MPIRRCNGLRMYPIPTAWPTPWFMSPGCINSVERYTRRDRRQRQSYLSARSRTFLCGWRMEGFVAAGRFVPRSRERRGWPSCITASADPMLLGRRSHIDEKTPYSSHQTTLSFPYCATVLEPASRVQTPCPRPALWLLVQEKRRRRRLHLRDYQRKFLLEAGGKCAIRARN